MTHLITLNQSINEMRENVMRLNVAKSRFFKKGDPFKIATDYDNFLLNYMQNRMVAERT